MCVCVHIYIYIYIYIYNDIYIYIYTYKYVTVSPYVPTVLPTVGPTWGVPRASPLTPILHPPTQAMLRLFWIMFLGAIAGGWAGFAAANDEAWGAHKVALLAVTMVTAIGAALPLVNLSLTLSPAR